MYREAIAQYGHDILHLLDPKSFHNVFFNGDDIVSNATIADILSHASNDALDVALAILPLPRRIAVAGLLEEGREVTEEASRQHLLKLMEKHRVYLELPPEKPEDIPAPCPPSEPSGIDDTGYDVFESPLSDMVDFWEAVATRVRYDGFASLDPYYESLFGNDTPPALVDDLTKGVLFMALSDLPEEEFLKTAREICDEKLAERKEQRQAMALTACCMARKLSHKKFAKSVGEALGLDNETTATLMGDAARNDTPRTSFIQTPEELFSDLATLYRKADAEGLLSICPLESEQTPFFAKTLSLVTDGLEPATLDEWLKLKLQQTAQQDQMRINMTITACNSLRRCMANRIIREMLLTYEC